MQLQGATGAPRTPRRRDPILALVGEYVGEAILKRAPPDPGRRVSPKRIAWLLGLVLSLTCIGVLFWRGQRQYFGDPLGRLERLITPHYH